MAGVKRLSTCHCRAISAWFFQYPTARPARYAALRKLSRVTDPAAFAAASARTAFGPIDVFILQRTGPARWTWPPFDAPYPTITFTPAQFSPDAFTVFTNLPGNYVLAVRRPPRNG